MELDTMKLDKKNIKDIKDHHALISKIDGVIASHLHQIKKLKSDREFHTNIVCHIRGRVPGKGKNNLSIIRKCLLELDNVKGVSIPSILDYCKENKVYTNHRDISNYLVKDSEFIQVNAPQKRFKKFRLIDAIVENGINGINGI